MPSVKPRVRPYTSPLIATPTYPTVVNGYAIREMEWTDDQPTLEERVKQLEEQVRELISKQ